ncbi:MAG TPA: FAD-binding oxidoreductase [Fimbriimonadaceae bacterium]|nr:FAD-binding oxidoreductase [Fimbriimonadaceae bacterium]
MVSDFRTVRPRSVEEVAEALREPGSFFITGNGGLKETFSLPTAYSDARQLQSLRQLEEQGWTVSAAARSVIRRSEGSDGAWTRLDTRGLDGIVEHDPADQVVVVRAGTLIASLQQELAAKGQCLPLPDVKEFGQPLAGFPGTIGGTLSMNLPHGLASQCGSWREWVLGMTVVRPNGSIAKAGSKAVKNVAGYDVQKLLIGARGTLAVVAEVILRTFPLKALPRPSFRMVRPWKQESLWIQRTLPAQFSSAVEAAGDSLLSADEASSTLWAAVPAEQELTRSPEDWVIRSGAGSRNLQIPLGPEAELMLRGKGLFDPDAKLNPGAMGIF